MAEHPAVLNGGPALLSPVWLSRLWMASDAYPVETPASSTTIRSAVRSAYQRRSALTMASTSLRYSSVTGALWT